jgi:hypothetical protein
MGAFWYYFIIFKIKKLRQTHVARVSGFATFRKHLWLTLVVAHLGGTCG